MERTLLAEVERPRMASDAGAALEGPGRGRGPTPRWEGEEGPLFSRSVGEGADVVYGVGPGAIDAGSYGHEKYMRNRRRGLAREQKK